MNYSLGTKLLVIEQELWVISGNRPVLWTVPVWVSYDARSGDAILYYAVPIMFEHQKAADSVLREFASPFNGMWRCRPCDLDRFARRSDKVKPEAEYSWERPKAYQRPEFKPEDFRDENDFIDDLHQQGVGKSREEVAYWWRQFCDQSLRWLAVKEKTVDMGFIKLHPCPFRENWKTILYMRFPKFGAATSMMKDPELTYLMNASGLTDQMMSGDMLAIKNKLVYRSVDVELSKTWYKTVKRVETARYKSLTNWGYAQNIADGVKRQLKRLFKSYRAWLAHIALPTARVEYGQLEGLYQLVPNRKRLRFDLRIFEKGLPYVVVPNKVAAFKTGSDAHCLFAQTPTLRELSDLQLDPKNLREHRSDLAQPKK